MKSNKNPRKFLIFEIQLTKARLVSGPSASIDTSPGYSDTLSTRNSDADFSIFLEFGAGKHKLPNPSEPRTKSATCGSPLYIMLISKSGDSSLEKIWTRNERGMPCAPDTKN